MNPKAVSLLGLLMLTAGCSQDRVLLLPGEGKNPAGAVAVLSEKGETKAVIDRAYTDARIGSGGVEKTVTSAATVEKSFGKLIGDLPQPPRRFILYFKIGTTELMPQSRPELDKLFAEVRSRPGADVEVVGHTSTAGPMAYNDRLSLRRAKEIAGRLSQLGLDPSLVRAAGRGERELLIKTGDNVNEPRNRRVEVYVR